MTRALIRRYCCCTHVALFASYGNIPDWAGSPCPVRGYKHHLECDTGIKRSFIIPDQGGWHYSTVVEDARYDGGTAMLYARIRY